MPLAKTPAFPFYGKDAYDDEAFSRLSFAEQGFYLYLAWWQWQEGSIPADLDAVLDKVPRRKVTEARRLWRQIQRWFPVNDHKGARRQNPSVENRRAKVVGDRDRNRHGADMTNAKRWGNGSLSDSVSESHSDTDSESLRAASASASASAISEGEFEGEFGRLWQIYPRKRGREKASGHFAAQVKSRSDLAAIVSAVTNYNREIELLGTADRYVLHGATFFNNRWRDYVNGTWKPPNGDPSDYPATPKFVSPDLAK